MRTVIPIGYRPGCPRKSENKAKYYGTNVEFLFDVPLAVIWYDEQRAANETDLLDVAPAVWGTPAEPRC